MNEKQPNDFEVLIGKEVRIKYPHLFDEYPEVHIDKTQVPKDLRFLLPIAEFWGLGDDYLREQRIEQSPINLLEELVATVNSDVKQKLRAWFESPEFESIYGTDAWRAFLCLELAVDSAEIQLGFHDQD